MTDATTRPAVRPRPVTAPAPDPVVDRPLTPRRRRRGLRIAAAVTSGAVLIGSGVAWAGVTRYLGSVNHVTIAGLTESGGSSAPMTILVVASDSRAGLTRAQADELHLGTADYGAPRTDTMMLVHIGADAGSVTVVSLPRDTLATIPAYTDAKGRTHPAHRAKLNAAFAEDGAAGMVATVESMTGVHINHYVEINFNGFLKMVDAVDGVEICLAKPAKDAKSGLNLPAGRQTVRGPQALAYVRARYLDGSADIGRMKRQQKFVASVVKKAESAGTLLNPVRLDAFLSALAGSITTDSGLGRDQLLDLADRLKGTNPANVAFMTVPLGAPGKVQGIGDVLTWDPVKAPALFAAINQDKPLVAPTTSSAPSHLSVPPGSISLAMFNGTSTQGLGSRAANDLAKVGFAIAGPAHNAPAPVGTATLIAYDPAYAAAARTVAAAIPGSTMAPQKGLGSTLHVTVGSSYNGAQKVKLNGAPAAVSPVVPSARTAAADTCS